MSPRARHSPRLALLLCLLTPIQPALGQVRVVPASAGAGAGGAGAAAAQTVLRPDSGLAPLGGLPAPLAADSPSPVIGAPAVAAPVAESDAPLDVVTQRMDAPVAAAPAADPDAAKNPASAADADLAKSMQSVPAAALATALKDAADALFDGTAAAASQDHPGGLLVPPGPLPPGPRALKKQLALLNPAPREYQLNLVRMGYSAELANAMGAHLAAFAPNTNAAAVEGALGRLTYMLSARVFVQASQSVVLSGALVADMLLRSMSATLGFKPEKLQAQALLAVIWKETGLSPALFNTMEKALRALPDRVAPEKGKAQIGADTLLFLERWKRRWIYALVVESILTFRAKGELTPTNDKEELERYALLDSPYFPWLSAADQEALKSLYREAGLPTERGYPDSTVEIETPAYAQILKLVEPEDGKLTGLGLKPGRSRGLDPAAAWKNLPVAVRMAALTMAGRLRKQDFFEDRRLLGLRVKRAATANFSRDTLYRGKAYAPGRHPVNLGAVFRDPVEYAGHKLDPGMMELHYRDNQSAGSVNQDAWTLMQGLNLPAEGHHVHIVAPLPLEALRARPDFQAARMTEFVGRVNLWAEMTDVIERGVGIDISKTRGVVHFGHLEPEMLRGIFFWLRGAGRGRMKPVGDDYKTLWVGFRGPDRYDRPDVYGLEHRAAAPTVDPVLIREGLDKIQQAMLADDYGLAEPVLKRWLKSQPIWFGRAQIALPAVWYNRPWPRVLAAADSQVKAYLAKLSPEILSNMRAAAGHDELKMLVHDWSQDPLVFEDKTLKNRILYAQLQALFELASGHQTHDVMVNFLVHSGLYGRVSASLGIDQR